MVLGTALLLVGIAIGYFIGNRRRPAPTPAVAAEPQPICGCRHHLSQHDPETGQCHDTVKEVSHYGMYQNLYQTVACHCRQYVGPEPLPTLIALDLTDTAKHPQK